MSIYSPLGIEGGILVSGSADHEIRSKLSKLILNRVASREEEDLKQDWCRETRWGHTPPIPWELSWTSTELCGRPHLEYRKFYKLILSSWILITRNSRKLWPSNPSRRMCAASTSRASRSTLAMRMAWSARGMAKSLTRVFRKWTRMIKIRSRKLPRESYCSRWLATLIKSTA